MALGDLLIRIEAPNMQTALAALDAAETAINQAGCSVIDKVARPSQRSWQVAGVVCDTGERWFETVFAESSADAETKALARHPATSRVALSRLTRT